MENLKIETGNEIVDRVTRMNFSGNVIPEAWYKTVVNKQGKPNLLAINILSDIVYWYRAQECRSENGLEVHYRKKFSGQDFLQRNYDQMAEKFNMSKNQTKDAVLVLEELGVIERVFRKIDTPAGPLVNVMFIRLDADVLERLTFPSEENGDADFESKKSFKNNDFESGKDEKSVCRKQEEKAESRCVENSIGVCRNFHTPVSQNVHTNTKTTTEITSENITATSITTTEMLSSNNKVDRKDLTRTDDVVVVPSDYNMIFEGIGLAKKDILKIVSAAKGNLETCKNAVSLLKEQPGEIRNVVGWLIRAITDGYKNLPRKFGEQKQNKNSSHVKNSFFDFTPRVMSDTDWEALEKSVFVN